MTNQKRHLGVILLVEDNEGDIVLTQIAFEACKLETELLIARNGQEAIDFLFQRGEYVHAKRPDLILLDINLPLFNGLEVLRQVKANSNLKKIPVIMLTTSSNLNDIDEAYRNHCNSYVKKSLEMSDFLDAIMKIEEFWLHVTTSPEG
jgi:CheY-like chemotaxis protein